MNNEPLDDAKLRALREHWDDSIEGEPLTRRESLLATLIAKREGFGIPGALPTRQNNPGDLRHANGESHDPADPNGIQA